MGGKPRAICIIMWRRTCLNFILCLDTLHNAEFERNSRPKPYRLWCRCCWLLLVKEEMKMVKNREGCVKLCTLSRRQVRQDRETCWLKGLVISERNQVLCTRTVGKLPPGHLRDGRILPMVLKSIKYKYIKKAFLCEDCATQAHCVHAGLPQKIPFSALGSPGVQAIVAVVLGTLAAACHHSRPTPCAADLLGVRNASGGFH